MNSPQAQRNPSGTRQFELEALSAEVQLKICAILGKDGFVSLKGIWVGWYGLSMDRTFAENKGLKENNQWFVEPNV